MSGGRIRRVLAAATLAAAVCVASAAAAGLGPTTKVTVKPGSGTPQTHFAFSFRVPVATGTSGSVTRTDRFSASGPHGTQCQSTMARTLKPAKKGKRLKLTLRPARSRGGWCPGQWHGTVVQSLSIRCNPAPAHACPQLVIAPRTIASFRFRVKPAVTQVPPPAPTGDVPKFAGLISATSCPSPGPVRAARILPQPRGYTLTWTAATDPVTPTSEIVYDIFVATSPGAEDYSKPSYTTSPGVSTYLTPSIPRSGPVYFVVRARNTAGHEDTNTVEKQGITGCPPLRPQS